MPVPLADRRLRAAIFILLMLSIALLVWQHLGLNRVLRLDGESTYQITALSDRDEGGASVATLQRQGQRLLFDCKLKPDYEWPYCELRVSFSNDPHQGIDFSRFSHIALKVSASGTGAQRLRLFLRDFDIGSAKADDPLTWRLNELQFEPRADGSEIKVPMRAFNVASWWLNNNNIPIERAAVEMQNVPMLLLDTAGVREKADLQFKIDYIEFRGKWVSAGEMALFIVALWLCAAITYLAHWQLRMRSTLAHSREREAELQELNAALMLENAKIGEKAKRDPLTGALNRAGIRDALLDEAARALDEERPLAVIFCDIDHFKRVNDEHGHAMGDTVLQQFSALLRKRIRQRDYLVRWGGEEFVLLCPDTSLEHAGQLAQSLRYSTEANTWPTGQTMTASFGVTTLATEPLATFLERADRALYEAKHRGRNTVVTLPPPV
ncbi:sensor domain-containing diguanylate cyclase [Jeongeupia naejangsanensis]|uniref:diguanylate cyclase n=1 Tax=Jeongeupia naejangsanensis TaxID=613195 RepID=A0ABS2BIF5_9NEIS|nr:GGDEF domain-containing protein [Jeongeupia naejangsanensis]MBM3115393.1 GGDEF domain-containing protein [Jeongeupia naejangsanensis]